MLLRSAGQSHARVSPVCETLENRQLLSASVGPVVSETGELTFYGTAKADKIEVSRNAAGLLFNMNGTEYAVGNDKAVTKITVLGNGGADVIDVFETKEFVVGDLTIDGGGGNDKISSGAGNDTLIGGKGHDLVLGGGGNDNINGGGGNDRMTGGKGADNLIGAAGKNVYNSGGEEGDQDDSGGKSSNIQSVIAATPTITDQADPLAVFGTRTGLTPGQIRTQYAFGNLADSTYTNRGAGQAIAVVIPYDVDSIYTSVNTFSTEFGLPAVNSTNLTIINATGTTAPADPDPFNGWEAEAALQLEWAHAIAPLAQLYLVLADSDLFTDLFVAVDKAVDTLVSRHGGGVALMSFGSQTGELNPRLQAYLDQSFTRRAAQNVTFVTGSGDASTVSYPSVSPYVVSVGGTSLQRDIVGGITGVETGWELSGGGLAGIGSYPLPGFQTGYTAPGIGNLPRRATPDVALNADPNSGLALFVADGFGDVDGDGTDDSGWLPGGAGGTSAAAPIMAGLIALANEQRADRQRGFLGENFNDVIYDLNTVYPGAYFTDITTGNSGGNVAGPGYDLVTGLGSPVAQLLIDRLSNAATRPIATSNVEWYGEFLEAINRTGPLAGPGGGFINGTGAISGMNEFTMTLVPRPDLTPTPPPIPASSTETRANQIAPNMITVTNFTPVTLIRLENNNVVGRARATVSILLEPLIIPPVGTVPPPGTTVPPPPPPPTPIPGQGDAGVDETEPVTVPRIQTWNFALSFTGKISRNDKGREEIKGSFISPDREGGFDPIQGDEAIFRGKFETE